MHVVLCDGHFDRYRLRSRDGTVVRTLAYRCHMWVELVVGSRLAPRVLGEIGR